MADKFGHLTDKDGNNLYLDTLGSKVILEDGTNLQTTINKSIRFEDGKDILTPTRDTTLNTDLNFNGTNVCLRTSSETDNDSGDLIWYYGNGQEKARIYTSNEYTIQDGLNFRMYTSSGTLLLSEKLAIDYRHTGLSFTPTSSFTVTQSAFYTVGKIVCFTLAIKPKTNISANQWIDIGAFNKNPIITTSCNAYHTGDQALHPTLCIINRSDSVLKIVVTKQWATTLTGEMYISGSFILP